jgi:hypothetical protein
MRTTHTHADNTRKPPQGTKPQTEPKYKPNPSAIHLAARGQHIETLHFIHGLGGMCRLRSIYVECVLSM